MKKQSESEVLYVGKDYAGTFKQALLNAEIKTDIKNESITVNDTGEVTIMPTRAQFFLNLGMEYQKLLQYSQKLDPTINFCYFLSNFPHEFIEKVWADNQLMAVHFKDKLDGFIKRSGNTYVDYNTILRWFFELDEDNMDKLIRWVNKNYHYREVPAPEPNDFHYLRLFQVNLQSSMIIDRGQHSIIYAVANHHLKWMVYNKPLITGDELKECRAMFVKAGFVIEKEIQTDSFSMAFWNPSLEQTTMFTTDIKDQMDALK